MTLFLELGPHWVVEKRTLERRWMLINDIFRPTPLGYASSALHNYALSKGVSGDTLSVLIARQPHMPWHQKEHLFLIY